MCQGCRDMGLVGEDGNIDPDAVFNLLFKEDDGVDPAETRMDGTVQILRTVSFGNGSFDRLTTPTQVLKYCEDSAESISRQMSGYTIAASLMVVLHRYETLLRQWAALHVDTVDDGEFPDDAKPAGWLDQDNPELDINRTAPAPSLGDFRPGMYL